MRSGHSRRERGTTLLLVPAATLVLIVLGAIAVDLSTIHLARRELVRAVAHAADDGASVIDVDHLRRTGEVRVDRFGAAQIVRAQLETTNLPGRLIGAPRVAAGADDSVIVTATLEVEHLFAKGIPGAPDTETITVRAEGRLLPIDPNEPP